MYQFREFTSLYDLHYSNASIPTIKDPLEGKTRFSGIATIEIKKPLSKVRLKLFFSVSPSCYAIKRFNNRIIVVILPLFIFDI
jgi:hypothetical protein